MMPNMSTNAIAQAVIRFASASRLKSSSGCGCRFSAQINAPKAMIANTAGMIVASGTERMLGKARRPKMSDTMNTASKQTPSQSSVSALRPGDPGRMASMIAAETMATTLSQKLKRQPA